VFLQGSPSSLGEAIQAVGTVNVNGTGENAQGVKKVGSGAVWIFGGDIPNPVQFSRVRDLARGSPDATGMREIPSASLRAGSSLRLKNGSGQDDAVGAEESRSQTAPRPKMLRITMGLDREFTQVRRS